MDRQSGDEDWDMQYEGWGYDDESDPVEDALDECGMTAEGCCTLAGTEHCDFECPFRDGGHPMLEDVAEDA